MPTYTPTQQKLLAVLSDGLSHHRDELYATLGDPLASIHSLHSHLNLLRAKLRMIGQDIVSCRGMNFATLYRHVRCLHSAYDGNK